MKPAFAVAAEVLQIKDPVSASMLGMIAASLVSELSPANGEMSPSAVEGESDPFQSTFIIGPDDSEVSEFSTIQESGAGETAIVPQSTVDSAQSEVLPAVLDEILSSPFHEPVASSQPSTELPPLPVREIPEAGPRGSFVSSSNSNTGSPAPTGGGDSVSFGSGTSSAETTAAPTMQASATGEQGDIQPLQIETQSKPASDGFGELTTFGESGENEPPFADDDYYSILHDTALDEFAPGVLSNDWDDDGDLLDAVLDSGPSFASSFTFNSDGSFYYEPISAWSGTDSFTYHATDGLDDSLTATVTIDVTNEVPFADDDYYSLLHDTTLTETAPGVISNDWDDDGDDISNSATLDVGPTNGTLNYFNSDGSFEYVPNSAWSGTDSFTYHISDGLEDSNIATVTIDVTNEAPFADGEFFTILQGTTLRMPLPGVLANDWDDDNDPLTANLITDVSNGSLTLNEDGSFSYTPLSEFVGVDSFTYVADDGLDPSFEATVDIEVVEWYLNIRLDSNNDGEYLDPDDELVEMDDPGMVFGVNDDDDNQNGIIDFDPTEAPFLIVDENGNPVPINDDDLVKAELEYGDYTGIAEGDKEGLQLQLTSSLSNIKIWSSQSKQYDLTGAKFVFEEDQVARWYAPDGSPKEFPSMVYLEGIEPGTAVVALALLDNMNAQMDDDKAKATTVMVDIDTDSDNDGMITAGWRNWEDELEALWREPGDTTTVAKPGNIIKVNENANGPPVPEGDEDLELVTINYDAGGADLTGYELHVTHGSGVKLWLTQSKDPLPDEESPLTNLYVWTIGNQDYAIPTSIYVEGIYPGMVPIDLSIHRPSDGAEIHGDRIRVTTVDLDIRAYRPITPYFSSVPVPEAVEDTIGAGIRRNGDDDDNDGVRDFNVSDTDIVGENDLIKVTLHVAPAGKHKLLTGVPNLEYRLKRTSGAQNINVWGAGGYNKPSNDPVLVGNDDWVWIEDNSDGDGVLEVWVEWVNMDPAATSAELELSVWDTHSTGPGEAVFTDTIKFYPFNSIIVGFMGNEQDPATDTDEGMYEMIHELYTSGYDARIFPEDDVGDDYTPDPQTGWTGEQNSLEAVANAESRGVTQVAIFGYSHGGGATYLLSKELDDRNILAGALDLDWTGYIDGVKKNQWNEISLGSDPETRLPINTNYHYNVWQTGGEFIGDYQGNTVPGANVNDNVEDPSDGGLAITTPHITHNNIDNHDVEMANGGANVQDSVLGSLKGHVNR